MALTSNTKTDTNTVELLVSVDKESFQAAVSDAYRKNSKKLNVPGFRKGKAPRGIIEKMYGEGIFYEDAVNDSYSKAYEEAVKEADITPVDRPEIEILDVTGDGYSFKAIVTVKPEVTLGEYKGLAAERTVREVSDAEIDAEIDKLVQRNARIVDITDRPAEMGDITVIDFDGSVDGVQFDGGKAEKFSLTLGSGQFIPGFEEQVAGHKIDEEFDVTVTFPADYGEESLAGKEAVFKCKIHEIKSKELPAVDDELAKDVSEFESLQELRDDIKGKLDDANKQQSDSDVENALVEQIIANITVEVPQCMIEQRIDEQIREFEYRLQSQGMNLDIYLQYTGSDRNEFRKNFEEGAVKQVKIRLALEAIAKVEALLATEEDLEAEYAKLAEGYRLEVDQIKSLLNPDDLKQDIEVNKAVDLVKDSAKIKDVKEKKAPAKKPAAKKTSAKKAEDSDTAEEKPVAKKPAAKKPAAKSEDADKPAAKKAPAKKPAAKKNNPKEGR